MEPPRIRALHAVACTLLIALVALTVPLAAAPPALAARIKTIRIADASIVEGDAGQQNLSFKVTWTGSKGGAAPSVHYATADVTATAGIDYTTTSGTATLTNGGCRCATITVSIKGDVTTEGTEAFRIDLSSPVNGTIADDQATGTIYDNEGPPALIVLDTSANEAAGALSFTVGLTNPSASTVTVDYATAAATAVDGLDYSSTSGTLTFAPGETSKSVSVTVNDDLLAEEDETLLLNLSNSSNAVIVDAAGVGSIVNDDADPIAEITDVSVAEGDIGTATATFTVSLGTLSGLETAVDYATSDGTAAAGVDYASESGTLTIPAGIGSATFEVSVMGDTLHEGDETFGVTLSGEVNLTLGTTTAVGTIIDDEPVPTVDAQSAAAGESDGSVTVTISLSNPTTSAVSVDWSTADGSATAGADYTAASGSASIPAGETSIDLQVPLLGDTADEPDETFAIELANSVNATVGSAATVTVTDDDLTPTALTAKIALRKSVVKVRGLLEPSAAALGVKVILLKKKVTRFVPVARELVAVKGLKDRDGDGAVDGKYLASFARPAKGTYRCKVIFAGTGELGASVKTVTFKV